MSVDEFVKLILGVALAISILGIAIQLMRLLGQMVGAVGDAREGVKSVSRMARMASDDYAHISHLLNKGLRTIRKIKQDFYEPIAKLIDLIRLVFKMFSKN